MDHRTLAVHWGQIRQVQVTSLTSGDGVMNANSHILTEEWYHLPIQNMRLVNYWHVVTFLMLTSGYRKSHKTRLPWTIKKLSALWFPRFLEALVTAFQVLNVNGMEKVSCHYDRSNTPQRTHTSCDLRLPEGLPELIFSSLCKWGPRLVEDNRPMLISSKNDPCLI